MRQITQFILITFTCVYSKHVQEKNVKCNELPENVLERILGAAYNPRYMSVAQPLEITKEGSTRDISILPSFYMDNTSYSHELNDIAAWNLNSHRNLTRLTRHRAQRKKRKDVTEEKWHCKYQIVWKDLGPDYFPRFVRNVECISDKCFYDMFKCKPRSFGIKILKRKRELCVADSKQSELTELWVWEEIALNFCCDCCNER